MKTFLIAALFIFTNFNLVFSQSQSSSYGDDVFLQIPAEEEMKETDKLYLDLDWKRGNLVKKDSSLMTNLAFRYDVRNDRFEMWSLVNPNSVGVISVNGKFFIHSSYEQSGYIKKGYFELITTGYAKLLIKRKLKFVSERFGAYGSDTQQKIIEVYYIKTGNNPAQIVDFKNNDISILFPVKTEKIKKYIKNKKPAIRKRGLIKLVNYYNSILEKV